MSDYVFRWRNEMRLADWNLTYYTQNPYAIKGSGWERESYAYGRFWEIIDFYQHDPVNTEPTDLGYIMQTDFGTQISYDYMRGNYWYQAFDYDDPDTTYRNTDNYVRHPHVYPLPGAELGGVILFDSNRVGVVEKIYSTNDYIISYWGLPTVPTPFHTQRIINNQYLDHDGLIHNLVGIIENPIHQIYDNIIEGKPLYFKLPFWMYKRILLQRRGELL